MALLLGIDDAGRGPLIGPMILAGVLVDKNQEAFLKKHGITDSKLLEHKRRMGMAKLIQANSLDSEIVKSTPEEIDYSITTGINLNTLEAIKAAEIINKINNEKRHNDKIKVVIDCPSINISAWKNTLLRYIKYLDNLEVECEHKADFNHTSVSAASILAKCTREEEIEKIKKQFKSTGNIGSGYPSDPATKEFLKKHGSNLKDSGIFRKTWATWKSMFPEPKQSTLGEF